MVLQRLTTLGWNHLSLSLKKSMKMYSRLNTSGMSNNYNGGNSSTWGPSSTGSSWHGIKSILHILFNLHHLWKFCNQYIFQTQGVPPAHHMEEDLVCQEVLEVVGPLGLQASTKAPPHSLLDQAMDHLLLETSLENHPG